MLSRFFPAVLLSFLPWMALAADVPAPGKDLRADIAKRLDVAVSDVKPAAVAGLYEVVSGSEIGYVSLDGRYYIDGDVFDMESRDNLTENRRKQGRLAALGKIQEGDAIIFAPAGAVRHQLTVFTDIDCGYCRQLHSEIVALNRQGVRVRYLAYPRSGPDTESWRKAEAVWCSADRRAALTRAKLGEEVKAAKCASPVDRQYRLARDMDMRGTPAIITDDGEYLAGYMPAPRLLEYLDKAKAATAPE